MVRGDNTPTTVPVYLEEGSRRTFAVSLDWPGWARSGRNAEAAVDALIAYSARYGAVATAAGLRFPSEDLHIEVVARIPGNATTDFGAPGVIAEPDRGPLGTQDAERHVRLVIAAWARLDEMAARAPAVLRKGPRGGGRDRDAIVEHVLNSEQAYRRKAGIPGRAAKEATDPAAVEELRSLFLDQLRSAPGRGGAGEPPGQGRSPAWPVRYAARRFAWHALDHAWEIEDRSVPAD